MRISHLTATLLIIAVSTPALAWGPDGPMPPVPVDPWSAPWNGGWGGPGPFTAPDYPDALPPFGAPPFADPGGFPGPRGGPATARPDAPAGPFGEGRRQLSISRRATPDAYLIDIRLGNIDPAQVRILPQGRGLRIGYQTRAEDYRQDSFEGGYGNSYRSFSGSASQRLPLPPDADLAAMSREVSPDRIEIRIPRRDPRRSVPWSGPYWPEQIPQTQPD